MVEIEKSSITARSRTLNAIKLISILCLLISIFHLVKLIQVLLNLTVLRSLPLSLPPLLLAGEGLIWFLSGSIIAWGLWKRRAWSRPALFIGSIGYSLLFWVKQIWSYLQAGSAIISLFDILLTAAGLGLVTIVLFHPASRAIFGEKPVRIP